MSADDRLDQDNWTPPANWESRAAALTAAVHRHADIPSWDQGGTDVMLATAERFAHWIEGGER
ncbi:MAG TPA: hypothetical protein VFK52_00200 [Nocardioidaceae bacterium]|nr:hypothetical protein [Nocardioidaceae bacterium]